MVSANLKLMVPRQQQKTKTRTNPYLLGSPVLGFKILFVTYNSELKGKIVSKGKNSSLITEGL